MRTAARLAPAPVRRLIRDVLAARTELAVVRAERDGPLALPGPYLIKAGYAERLTPSYDDLTKVGAAWQAPVYERVARAARERGIERVVDIGCGDARNQHLLGDLQVIGIDYGANLEAARCRNPSASFVEADLDRLDDLPVDVTGAAIVCADVVEHLVHPEKLLGAIRKAMASARVAFVSTPDRDLWWGRDHTGPPPNLGHVREWNRSEFGAFLASQGLEGTTEIVQSNDIGVERKTILAVIENAR